MIKINGLTRSNVRALREVFAGAVAEGDIVLTATTATWTRASAEVALIALDTAMNRLPVHGHPRASLHAVRRKLERARV